MYDDRNGAANDIHLKWGDTSRDLRLDRLVVVEVLPTGDARQFAFDYKPADIVLEFKPMFRATLTGDEYEAFGIRVNRTTGVVTFTTPAPQPLSPNNFIIEAFVSTNTGGINPLTIRRAPIRVHVYTGVTRIWLTPNPITIRRVTPAGAENSSNRFTVRAEFADGTVGDVTDRHGVTWSPASNVGSGFDVGKLSVGAGDLLGAKIEITASWQGVTAKADMVVAGPWSSDPAMPKADLVDGHPDTWAGTINPSSVPNVLIFGSGFTAADVPKLEPIANTIVHHLKTDTLTTPYDRLATSMNFWRVAPATPARGASVRCEVYTFPSSGRTWAKPLPRAISHVLGAGWTLENLIYDVGFPVPADALVSEIDLHARWSVTMRDPPAEITSTAPLPSEWKVLVDNWKKLATRTFIDELDGFPEMALGDPPSASALSPMLRLHPDRVGRGGLVSFYTELRASNGVALAGPAATNALGNLWSSAVLQREHFNSIPLVVMVAAIRGGRAQQIGADPAHIAMSLKGGDEALPVKAVAGRNALTFDFFEPISESVERDFWRTMAHELGHAFGLGDEYVDLPGAYKNPETSVDGWGNLTTEAAVRPGNVFNAALIKWDWHRAKKAAFIDAAPTAAGGGNFVLQIVRAAGQQFAINDPVFLRVRAWQSVIGRAPITSGPLTVVAVAPDGKTVTVSGALGAPEAVFVSGSVLYLPVKDPIVAGLFLNVLPPKIAKFINDKQRPLSPWPCVDADQIASGTGTVVPEYDGYDGFWSHRNDIRTIGLYNGGVRQGCGIFHPAGQCMMRNTSEEFSEFCHVCRFVLVEMIDARQHFAIDRDYDEAYPK
ncbi:MAG: M64 family metallo-endopeptidase [Gemmatimonadota bacterium]|nr:M64 family metallo-endopeptidase [Gemmatimonadota bacterium]